MKISAEMEAYAHLREPCCDGMATALKTGAIGWGEYTDSIWEKDFSKTVFTHSLPDIVQLFFTHIDWEYRTGFPISFCPFCGEKIEVIEGE